MSRNYVTNPYPYYNARNLGKPIYNGKIYIGKPNLDPTIPANQLTLTAKQQDGVKVPISQPVSTNTGGYAVDLSGNLVVLLVEGDYAIRINDNSGSLALEQASVTSGTEVGDSLVTADGTLIPRTLGNWMEKEVLSYNSISDAKSDPLLEVGRRVITYGYHTEGDSGGGEYMVVASGTGIDDGGAFIDTVNGLQLSLTISGPINVRQFGAVADAVTDDQPSIQAAVNYSFKLGHPFHPIYIPTGSYAIWSPIDRRGSGFNADIYGDGRRDTIIYAGGVSTFYSMITLAAAGDVTGNTTVRDLTLDCKNLAQRGIDAQIMRYWTLDNVAIENAPLYGLWAGNWVVRILNSRFLDCHTGVYVDGTALPATSSQNSFIISQCEFTSCTRGVTVQENSNDVLISQNAFDACGAVGIWINRGGRKIDIINNYFEACGKTNAVSIPLSSSTDESMAAPIIISYNWESLTFSKWNGVINNNFFVNNNPTRLIALYNVLQGVITENRVYPDQLNTQYFVELRKEGCAVSSCRGLVIDGYYDTADITTILGLNGDSASGSACNIQVSNRPVASLNLPQFYVNDPTATGWGGATTINVSSYGGYKQFEFDSIADGSSIDRTLTLDFTSMPNHPLLGRYIRVTQLVKGSVISTGVRLRISVDSVYIIDMQNGGAEYVNNGRDIVIYIPLNSVQLQIRLDALSSSNNAKMIGFCVCDASYPIDSPPIASL